MPAHRKHRLTALALLSSAAALATACGRVTTDTGERVASDLVQAESCDHLLQMIREDAVRRIDAQADQALRDGVYGMPGVGGAGGGFDSGSVGTGGSGVGGGGGGPSSPPVVSEPEDHSTTNNQVAGVEEADILQTDGERLWLLQGSELQVLRTWPPQSLSVTSSLPVEGSPVEMLVAEGRAVIFSLTWRDGGHGDEMPCWDGMGASGMGCGGWGAPVTKLTVVVLDGDSPRVERELWIEGDYRSARGHDGVIRAIVDGGYKLPPGVQPDFGHDVAYGPSAQTDWAESVERWRARAKRAAAVAPLEAWLPVIEERSGAAVEVVAPSCTSYFSPPPGRVGSGLTTVLSLELGDALSKVGGASVLGATSLVYANADALVLAHPEYRGAWNEGETTSLHRFALDDGGGVAYTGSGAVAGRVLNQFSLDEQRGVVRVATTEDVETPDLGFTTVNRVVTLGPAQAGLEVLGSSEPLAPGERIYSARFLGDRAYVVTFRQVDPLFVVDLANPAAPVVLGELKIPGFSEYLHPLGPSHLLTIGRNLDDEGGGEDRLALQIFDVSDPVAPRLAHKHVFAEEGSSEASYDHRAFTFSAERGLLAFPFQSWSWDESASSLRVFGVDVEAGFTVRGAVRHGAVGTGYCGGGSSPCYPIEPQMRRGVFVEDFVYSVSDTGVAVHAVDRLDVAVATADLPAPRW